MYLDNPAVSRRRPAVPRVSRRRSRIAGTFAIIGLVALGLALIGAGLQVLVLDPEPVTDGFDAALADGSARLDLEQRIATAIQDELVGDDLTAVAAAFDLDVTAESGRLAPLILDDPAVQTAMRRLVTDLHTHVLVERDHASVDFIPFTLAARAVIDRESPGLSAIISPETMLWTIDPGSLPDLTTPAGLVDSILPVLFFASLLLAVGAAIHPRRHLVVSWAGWATLGFGIVCGLAAVALPHVGEQTIGGSAIGVAIRSESLRLFAPAGLAAVVGSSLTSLATVARRREARRVTEEGAAAALGYDEPPLWQQTSKPTLDLASRGLVDVERPLTNL